MVAPDPMSGTWVTFSIKAEDWQVTVSVDLESDQHQSEISHPGQKARPLLRNMLLDLEVYALDWQSSESERRDR